MSPLEDCHRTCPACDRRITVDNEHAAIDLSEPCDDCRAEVAA